MRGKNTEQETIYAVMAAWAVNPNNLSRVSQNTGVPWSTVKQIVRKYQDNPEFVRLREQKKDEFAQKAGVLILKALDRLEAKLDNKDDDIPANQLTTVIGTLYDKRALAEGDSTDNQKITVNIKTV